jgi:nucleotide-binding universal stress UspA family protein
MKNSNGGYALVASEPVEASAPRCAGKGDGVRASRPVKRILVPVDFSECSLKALEYASGFAGQLGARMTVLHVVEPALHAGGYPAISTSFDPTSQNLLENSRDRLSEIGRKHLGNCDGSDFLVRMGRAPSEILDTAKALGVDMIVLGTPGSSDLKHVLLGSTAERVLRQAVCPVVTVRCV